MKETKEDKESVDKLEHDAEAARTAGVDDGQYHKEDEDPTWQTDTGDGC